jgi:hypothetical protein
MQFHLTYTDNATNDYSINQGSDYKRPIKYPGDVSLWTPRGSIRYTWLHFDPNSQPLATFSFPTLIYDTTSDKTFITLTLTSAQTILMPPTERRQSVTSAVVLGHNVYVYDVILISPSGFVNNILSGYVEVNPMCTKP